MKFFLDTDTLSLLFHQHPKILSRFRSIGNGDATAITIVTRIELLRGRFDHLLKAATKVEWLAAQARLIADEREIAGYEIVLADEAAADHLVRLRSLKKLKKVGLADLMIASIALANQATLVTRNVKDFQPIPGLTLENWAD